MKKWILATAVLLLAVLALDYIAIPNYVQLKSQQGITVTQPGLHRMLLTQSNVSKWWPGNVTAAGELVYNGNNYTFANNNISLLPVVIKNAEKTIQSSLYIVSQKTDSVHLAWVATMATSYNPIKRFTYWLKAKQTEADMDLLLQKMEQFYRNTENIYGIKVEKALVADSLLITTGANSTGYPTVAFIYAQIDKLKKYALANGAAAAGYPMLNVETGDSTHFNVRVALPLNKAIPGNGKDIEQKRMLGLGNILVAEVKGGITTTTEAFKQINLYARDYQRTPPAIPFYSLITDRTAEPDSSKWITKVYCPVM